IGDYAFALWDKDRRRLILARDPMSARPLHYHRGRGFFAFASMPKGLHALPEIPYAPDEERAAEFLALMPEYGPRSFFRDISRVEGGQWVEVTPAGFAVRRHWEPRRETLRRSSGDHVEALREQLDRAVAARLRRVDGPIGTQLSAGLDSAGVAATAARLLAPRGETIAAFTSAPREGYHGPAPPGRIIDESGLAGATAASYPNMDHVVVRPDGSGLVDELDRDFFLFERPVLNACNQLWLRAIYAEAQRRKIGVMLTGTMGNFTISYAGRELLPELAGSGRWLGLLRQWRAQTRSGRVGWRGLLAATFGPWIPARLWLALQRFDKGSEIGVDRYSALSSERLDSLDLEARARERGLDLAYRPSRDGFSARLLGLRRVDMGNVNKGVLAGWGVDLRDPTSDRRLVEFCLSLPGEAFVQDGLPRSLALRGLADRLPPEVIAEKRKGLQAADWHEAIAASRERLREEIERIGEVPAAARALDLARMRRLIDEWPSDGWHLRQAETDYRLALLRGVVSGHFLRRASRSNA
ncbi:asparagine synthetase B family protein, partial [Allosphingosinicella sp.]|uniref:asparagine synthetase B family protein n=1 Tax=Allosphingosinicella sp. TaxID=2823234 RepID=UPI002F03764A